MKRIVFTRRERDINSLIAKDLENLEIAEMLGMSIRTVQAIVYNIFKKAGVKSRLGLTIFLIKKKHIKISNCMYSERRENGK